MVAPYRGARATESISVHVSGRDPLVRSGLVGLLSQYPVLDVLGASLLGDAPGLVAQVHLRDAGPQGADADLALDPGRPTLVLVPDREGAARALRAGARGVLHREVEGGHLVAAVRAVAAGLVVHAPELMPINEPPRARPIDDPLSPREHEVLQLVAEGLPNKLVADRLGISEHTAKFHVNAILDKLGVTGRTEAVVHAARRGWITL
jgi:DNA-binding NarL/FixJ family response regulator